MERIAKEDTSSSSNKSLLSICCWIIVIGCIVLAFLSMIEQVLFSLLRLVSVYSLLAVLLDAICHLLLIRYLVVQISFAGQFYFIRKQTYYSIGFNQAKYISKYLTSLENNLIKLNSRNIHGLQDYKELKKSIKQALDVIRYYITIFQQMIVKYGNLSPIQNKFLREIMELNDKIIDIKLIEFIANDINNIKANKTQTISYLMNHSNSINGNDDRHCFDNIINNRLLPHIAKAQIIIDDYTNEGRKWYSLIRLKALFYTEFLGTLKQQRIELAYEFDFDDYALTTEDNTTIDYIIIKGKAPSLEIKNNLMIICGPNGASFELFSKNIRLQPLYLEKNCDVLCWNYRGFGFSTGRPTFDNIKTDVKRLYDTVTSFNRWNKIGVHGISIGGIPCCHLARNKRISLLVSDRNFGAIDLIPNALKGGNCLVFLYKLLLLPNSYTIDDYLNSNCYKIVLNDPNDMIVRESSSLKTSASRFIIQKHLCFNNIELDTSIVMNNRTIQTKQSKCSSKNGYVNYKDILDLILPPKHKQNFIASLIALANVMTSSSFEQSAKDNCALNKCCKKSQYKNLKEEELQNTSGLFDFIKFKLGDFFDSFGSAGDCLASLIDITNTRLRHLFICDFFSNLVIWGNKKSESPSFCIEDSVETLREAIEILNTTLATQEVQNNKTHFVILSIQELMGYLKQIEQAVAQLNLNKTMNLTTQLMNNSSHSLTMSQQKSLNEQLCQLGKGNLIHLKCGHNGQLHTDEFSLLIEQIELSGFLNSNNH